MSCFHPRYAFIAGTTENGKKLLHFCTPKTGDFGDVSALKHKYRDSLVAIPCGKCVGCKLDYSKSWAVRCVLESLYHKESSFLTLTYDEAHCPKTLDKKPLSDFLKRLRSAHPDISIRFFGCGERGSLNNRPHYHVIIFGYSFPDKEVIQHQGHQVLYKSKELSKLWSFGLSSIGEVSLQSCAYVARYTSKKVNGKKDEFILMSRMPGIGAQYFADKKDLIYLSDKLYGSFGSSHKARVPRYFDKLAEKEGIDLSDVKDNRIRRANLYNELGKYLHSFSDDIPLNQLMDRIALEKFNLLKRYV